MTAAIVGLLLRHALTAFGAVILTKGWFDAGSIDATIGALTTLGGIAWSAYQKYHALHS